MQIIEPYFADITYNKKMNRFSLRKKIKTNIQWLLYCMVHNREMHTGDTGGGQWLEGGRGAKGLAKGRAHRTCLAINPQQNCRNLPEEVPMPPKINSDNLVMRS
jgi:hypothetical protein